MSNPNKPTPYQIDVTFDHMLSLAQAAKLLPEPPSPVTMWRWRSKGVSGTLWFAHETKRVYAMLRTANATPDSARVTDQAQRHLVDWIRKHNRPVTGRDLYRNLGTRYPTPDAADVALQQLVSGRIGQWNRIEPTSKGGRASREFVLFE